MEYERKRNRGSPAEFVGLKGLGRRPGRLDHLLEAACSGHVVGITRHVTKGFDLHNESSDDHVYACVGGSGSGAASRAAKTPATT